MRSVLTYLSRPDLFGELAGLKGQFYAVIDEQVKSHLPDWVLSAPGVFWIKTPESEKNLQTYEKAIQFFLHQGITRNSTIVAIGGGATTDLGGFIAATILRGLRWIAVPTTLLAMVDGSIGGKVAVNMAQGKNLVGAFHSPEQIFICRDFLQTLSDSEFESGKGEILKYGFLSTAIHSLILQNAPMDKIAHACAEFKMQIVEKDFKEQGERIQLNLGHTLGHAFESTLKISHGLAVAMGMKYLFKILDDQIALSEWEKMVAALGFPKDKLQLSTYAHFNVEKFKNYLSLDKKKSDQSLKLVLVKEIGTYFVEEVTLKELMNKIEAYDEFNR
jgi:3-dehydroquinate synthase